MSDFKLLFQSLVELIQVQEVHTCLTDYQSLGRQYFMVSLSFPSWISLPLFSGSAQLYESLGWKYTFFFCQCLCHPPPCELCLPQIQLSASKCEFSQDSSYFYGLFISALLKKSNLECNDLSAQPLLETESKVFK